MVIQQTVTPTRPAAFPPAEVVDVKPISESGAHTFYKGTVASSGVPVFIKHNAVKALFKSKALDPVNKLLLKIQQAEFPNLDRLQDMSEIMFSHFAEAYFEQQGKPYSGLTYQEVFFKDPATQQPHLYIGTPFVDKLETLDDIPVSQVSNPQTAVETTLMRGLLLGDWNCTFRDSNVGVAGPDTRIEDGSKTVPGEVIDMDYGDAGTRAIERLGVPYGNRKLLDKFPQYVKPAVDHIRSLSPEQINAMIADAGTHVTGWTPRLTDYFADILNANVKALGAKLDAHPTWLTQPNHINPLFHPGLTGFKQFVFRIPAGLSNFYHMKESGILSTIPSSDDVARAVAAQHFPSQTYEVRK